MKTDVPLDFHKAEVEAKEMIFPDVEECAASEAALGVLLEEGGAEGAEGGEGAGGADAEARVRRLGERLARLDTLNVAGMLAAACEGGSGAGARLAARLAAGAEAGAALAARRARCAGVARAGEGPAAGGGAARPDAAARALLLHLQQVFARLDAEPLRDLDALEELPLATAEERAYAVRAADALHRALTAAHSHSGEEAWRRLGGVGARVRRLRRAGGVLGARLARLLNNALLRAGAADVTDALAAARSRHAELRSMSGLWRAWRRLEGVVGGAEGGAGAGAGAGQGAGAALWRVYAGATAQAHQRALHAAAEAARAQLATAPPEQADAILDSVLSLVVSLCDAEQDFCTEFFGLDEDAKAEGGEGAEGGEKRAGAESRRLYAELFPTLEQELVALVGHLEKHDEHGAMRALTCLGRRVWGAEGGEGAGVGAGAGAGGGGGELRWWRAGLAAAAVAAKRAADRAVAARIAALPDAIKAASRRPRCGVFPFVSEAGAVWAAWQRACAGGRRADLERWAGALAGAALAAVGGASHPRTPRAVLQLENYHALGGALAASARTIPALHAARAQCRARYADALKTYVAQYFGQPLEKLTHFFESVSEAVAAGVREDEVCYRAALSKHELRRILALYPAAEVRKSLHRLYRTVEKHLSEEGGLLQVVWRAMQEEFIAQHLQLQARIAACYPGAGLSMPLTTQDILDAFSDIAREH